MVEFRFLPGSVVVFRSELQRAGGLSPPGCFTRNCINGPKERARMAELQASLGWPQLETDEDKRWVRLLLH